ncbi:MAG: ABC transporter substrate-binding protein [Trueperaceae bacterium]|nr:ABC transporter substrate-binding protein [Trueperaceae bacterium]
MRTPFRPIGPVLLALALALSSIGFAAGTLRMAITQDEGTLTPYTYMSGYPGYELMTLIYDQLFLLDEDLAPQPWLAESLTIADDDLAYTLTLREGLAWHDGEPLTADDVAFSIGYYQTHILGRFTTSANKVANVEVRDPRTVVLTLSAPDATFVQTGLADLPMLPQHVWADVEEPRQMAESMGSGPYMVAEYRADQFYRFVANPNYWGPEPTFDTIIAPIIRDETATFQALIAGDIDVATRPVPAGLVDTFAGRNDLELAQGPGFASTILIMDVSEGALADVEVRRIIGGSIDYGRLIDTLLLGYGTAGTPGFLHPASPFANPATAEYAHVSPAEARERLVAAGYERGADGVFVEPGRRSARVHLPRPVEQPDASARRRADRPGPQRRRPPGHRPGDRERGARPASLARLRRFARARLRALHVRLERARQRASQPQGPAPQRHGEGHTQSLGVWRSRGRPAHGRSRRHHRSR